MNSKKFLLYFSLILFGLTHLSHAQMRAIWVTRWDFASPSDIAKIMDNCQSIGTNLVYFQVRGNGTVFYPSQIEPWAWELTSDSINTVGKDPGWDPLLTALQEAKENNLDIQAWVNVFPGWRGKLAPAKHTGQLWVSKRKWFMVDHRGGLMYPGVSRYAFLSPGSPDVQEYLGNLMNELASSYTDLHGIHLDYIRYPAFKEYGTFRDYSYDTSSKAMYRQKYGKFPHYRQQEWSQFKRESVRTTIRHIREGIRQASPTMQLSATFMAEIHRATNEAGQDPLSWIENDLVDHVVPMVYRRDMGGFKEIYEGVFNYLGKENKSKVIVGLNADFNNLSMIEDQFHHSISQKTGGEAIFAYSALFKNHQTTKKATLIQTLWREKQINDIILRNDE